MLYFSYTLILFLCFIFIYCFMSNPKKPILIINHGDFAGYFGKPGVPDNKRTPSINKNWIDAYNTQIGRIKRNKTTEELEESDMMVLLVVLKKSVSLEYSYILQKYCDL